MWAWYQSTTAWIRFFSCAPLQVLPKWLEHRAHTRNVKGLFSVHNELWQRWTLLQMRLLHRSMKYYLNVLFMTAIVPSLHPVPNRLVEQLSIELVSQIRIYITSIQFSVKSQNLGSRRTMAQYGTHMAPCMPDMWCVHTIVFCDVNIPDIFLWSDWSDCRYKGYLIVQIVLRFDLI